MQHLHSPSCLDNSSPTAYFWIIKRQKSEYKRKIEKQNRVQITHRIFYKFECKTGRNTHFTMSSGFVTEQEIVEARQRRQEEWEKVRSADQPLGMFQYIIS